MTGRLAARHVTFLMASLLQIVPAPAEDEGPPILFDAYYVGVRCAGINARISRSSLASTKSGGYDLIGEVAAAAARTAALADAKKRLTQTCSAAKSLGYDAFEAQIDSIDATMPIDDDGASTTPLTDFVDLVPSSPSTGLAWGTTPESVKQMSADYYVQKIRVNRRSAEAIVAGFSYYVTFLVVDSTTPDNPSTPQLYQAFQRFGNRIGGHRAAVWLGKYSEPMKPDTDHGTVLALYLRSIGKYRYDFSSGPYLVFTDGPPDVAKSAFPIDLNGISTLNRVTWMDQLGDRLNGSLPPTTRLDKNRVLLDEVRIRILQWIPDLPFGAKLGG